MPQLSGGWSILAKDFNKSERIKYFVCIKSLLIHSGLVYVTSDLWSSAVALAGLWWIGWLLWDSCRRFRSLLGCYHCQSMLCCSDKQWNLRVLPALNRRRLGLINGVLTLCGLRPPRTAHSCTQSSGIRRLYPRWWKLRLNVWLSLWSIKLHQTDTSRIHGKEFQRHFVSWVVSFFPLLSGMNYLPVPPPPSLSGSLLGRASCAAAKDRCSTVRNILLPGTSELNRRNLLFGFNAVKSVVFNVVSS